MSGAALEALGLVKRFGGVVAVKDVGFSVEAGEIVGVIGPNGSGKSTLMKMIMGLERPNAGTVRLGGADVTGWPTHRLARRGLSMLFQHSRPLHRLSVLDNIILPLLPDRLVGFPSRRRLETEAASIAERVGLGAQMRLFPGELPFADLRRLEFAKLLAGDPRVVLLDEPFAGLTAAEAQHFAGLIADLRRQSRAVLLIDHNVRSLTLLADRMIALHHGEVIAVGSAAAVASDPLVRQVYIGHGISAAGERRAAGAVCLELDQVGVRYGGAVALDGMSLRVSDGECVAIVGHNGAGKTSLFKAISGLTGYSGSIRWRGADLAGSSAAAIARSGLVHCPETRELFGAMTVREHLDLAAGGLTRAQAADQRAMVLALFPKLADRAEQKAATMSGGEQQMLAIARSLMLKPLLLILDEPTLGLAPIVLQHISEALARLRERTGITVVLGEQNVTFALSHADRVVVLDRGRVVWSGPPAEFRGGGAEHMGIVESRSCIE